ncbi:hypothetical protein PZA11_000914 [Diplocarpon coronariae]|uniref:Uncharacterized protein n=1 Tax=Diplocarpon coronariae TaxID=2795749 RepID=A0A218ZD17_9HELO|nr:hypothetical protein B2J93_1691 [Marssonina coronariae]
MSGCGEKNGVVTASHALDDCAGASPNVLTITRPYPGRHHTTRVLSTIQDVDSAHSVTPPGTPSDEKDIGLSYMTRQDTDRDMYADLEAQALTEQKTNASLSTQRRQIDPAWPGRRYMKAQKKAAKCERARCVCWARLSKLYKGIIVTCIVLGVLGIALGIGFGLSRKVGGTIYDGTGKQVPSK